MKNDMLLASRLVNQQIARTAFHSIPSLLQYMGAMQAQEYAMAKWAFGLRLPGISDQQVEAAFNEGLIIRTHMLRPTWHFVSPANLRWMQALTAPRVILFNGYMYRQTELNEQVFKKSRRLLEKILANNNFLTRAEIQQSFAENNLIASGPRLAYIIMHAELLGMICSGPRKGKQFTYALVEERVPPAKSYKQEEALCLLLDLYFKSRGPASIADCSWWSGLTMKEIKTGIDMFGSAIKMVNINDTNYYYFPEHIEEGLKLSALNKKKQQTSFLMPDYDEYGISYKDRSAIINRGLKGLAPQNNNTAIHLIIIDGVIAGKWTVTSKQGGYEVETFPLKGLSNRAELALRAATKKYLSFFNWR